MSSILQALKKLESAPELGGDDPSWQQKFSVEHVRRHRGRKGRSKRSLAAALVMAGIVVVAGLLLWGRAPVAPREETAAVVVTSEVQQEATSVSSTPTIEERQPPLTRIPPAPAFTPGPQTPERAPLTPAPSVQVAPPIPAATAPAATPVVIPLPEVEEPPSPMVEVEETASVTARVGGAAADEEAPPIRVIPDEPERTRPLSQSPEPVVGEVPSSTVVEEAPASPPLPVTRKRLRDSAVVLQAIAWSEDPGRRMAVISGQIVREGDRVAGYAIQSIGEKVVVVLREGRTWELAYGP